MNERTLDDITYIDDSAFAVEAAEWTDMVANLKQMISIVIHV